MTPSSDNFNIQLALLLTLSHIKYNNMFLFNRSIKTKNAIKYNNIRPPTSSVSSQGGVFPSQ